MKLIIDQSNICFQSYPLYFSSFSFAKQKYLAKYARKFLAQYRQSHIQLPNMSQQVALRSQLNTHVKTPTNKHVGNIPLNNKNSHGLQNNIVNILPINIYTRIATRWEIYRNLDNQGNKSLLQILHGEILVKEKYLLVYSLKASWWLYTDCKLLKANVVGPGVWKTFGINTGWIKRSETWS